MANKVLDTLIHQYNSGVDKAPSDFKQKLDYAIAAGSITPAEASRAFRTILQSGAPTEWVLERGEEPIVEEPAVSSQPIDN